MEGPRGLLGASQPIAGLDGLYRAHRDAVCAYVRRHFGNGPPSPEEIAQDAFLRLAQHTERLAIPNPRGFLLLTARNLAIDAQRRRKREAAVLRSSAILSEGEFGIDAMALLSSRQELLRLAAVVDTLKPKERAAFLMHRMDGLTFSDIARRLRMSPSGARKLVATAFATCVERMSEEQGSTVVDLVVRQGGPGGQSRHARA